MTPVRAIYLLWSAWLVSWVLAAAWSAPTEKRPGVSGSARVNRILIVAGTVLLLFPIAPQGFAGERWWRAGGLAGGLLVGLVAAGFLFAWWARIHLGRLWSGSVVKKVGHHVVDTGPYRLVRHPIYTGIILAVLATAAAKGTAAAVLGGLVVTVALYGKARIEERFLRDELGAGAYDSYARRVPMLVPWT